MHGDRVYVRDSASEPPVILNKSDGSIAGTFTASTAPAFDGGLGFYTGGNPATTGMTLSAVNLGSNLVAWSQTGDGQLSTAPV